MKGYDFSQFGSCLFDNNKMRKYLSEKVYQNYCLALNHQQPLDLQSANDIASTMKDWAVEKGCTHYTHWFHPLSGSSAEKHNSFVEERDGSPICRFSGKSLIKDESDASSFPSGGLRASFEARGYTYWDIESPAFVRGHVLYIPTIFISYTDDSLDTKRPLLRSIDELSDAAVAVANYFNEQPVQRITPSIGLEQEYFLVDRDLFLKRRDLILTGKTLLGAAPSKGQELQKHYYGSIPSRVNEFMEDVNEQLWNLGIYAKAEHNEVAPGQFELTPIYGMQNMSIDQNVLVMDVLRKTALKHQLVWLLHEKPYANVNGSGKHNNYSLHCDNGENLFDPGNQIEQNIRFLLFTAAMIQTVDESAELIRLASSDSGNDFRLGGSEAPPAIISLFLGETIESIFSQIAENPYQCKDTEKDEIVFKTIASLPKDTSDRNRTAPIAFTGNKFEFRTLGSSLNASFLNTVINTALAKTLKEIANELKGKEDVKLSALQIIGKIYTKHKRVIFSGNGYSEDWIDEAKRRGLSNIPTFVESIDFFKEEKNVELFEKQGILSGKEIYARCEILYESYFQVRSIEIKTMTSIIYQNIIPSAIAEMNFITASPKECWSAAMCTKIEKLKEFIDQCSLLAGKAEEQLQKANALATIKEKDFYILNTILPICEQLREVSDKMEHYISRQNMAYPTYEELFFNLDY